MPTQTYCSLNANPFTMFYQDPNIMLENPPPPGDDILAELKTYEEDWPNIFFTHHLPQSVNNVLPFITVDRSLIHPAILGKDEQESAETIRGAEHRDDESIQDTRTGKRKERVPLEMSKIKVEAPKERQIRQRLNKQQKAKSKILEKDKSCLVLEEIRTPSQKETVCTNRTASNESNNSKKKTDKDAKISAALESISKSYSTKSLSESDSDSENRKKSKSSKHKKKSHKKSKHKKKDKESRDKASSGDVIPYDKVGFKSAEFPIKQETASFSEENNNSSISKEAEIPVKEEGLISEDDDERNKIKRSKKKHSKHSHRKIYHDDGSRSGSESSDVSRNRYDNDSRNKCYDDSRSRNSDDSRSRYSDDSRSRYSDDSSRGVLKSYIKKEIKREPGTTDLYSPLNDYYCYVCKLNLNSETTFNSHMAGKRHKKALRQQSELDVAKSSILELTESQNSPRPPDMERTELPEEESKIQQACDNANLLIVGLENVREIRGYDDTKYYCDLCDAQCVANSIIKHLIGFKHQMNCLKKYFPRSYDYVNGFDKKDRRVTREIKMRLEEEIAYHGKGRIRVFRDVRRAQRSFDPYQPSTSRQDLDEPDVSYSKSDDQKVTDEDCLSRDFSDFYCTVCDSHMNNRSMWESHARGKRHAKNKKKTPEGGFVTNSNFVEAPKGTVSHLERMIKDQCSDNDIIVGLNFIRENRGENGDLYNCYLCGSVCPSLDIIDHLFLVKHKTKYLEKIHNDGYKNGIEEINQLQLTSYNKENLINEECERMMLQYGHGRPVICVTKSTF